MLLGVAAGDRAALGALYGVTADRLLRVAHRLLGEQAEAEDVVHELFASLGDRAQSFDPGRSTALSWLVAVTRHRAIDRLRARGRKASAVAGGGDGNEGPPGSAAPPPAVGLALEERHTLERALAGLEPEDAQLLHAAYAEGLTYAELSERMGVPANTLKSRVRRSLLKIRQEWQG